MNIFAIYLLAYGIMLLLSCVHLMFNWKVLGQRGYESLEEVKTLGVNVQAYETTVPWQPLYNLLVFGVLSAVYLRGQSPLALLQAGLVWVAVSAITDPVLWILLPHPWRMGAREFYKRHMPWLLLCYLCVLAAPFAALLFR